MWHLVQQPIRSLFELRHSQSMPFCRNVAFFYCLHFSVSVCLTVCVCLCLSVCSCLHPCLSLSLPISVYVCLCLFLCPCLSFCVYLFVSACLCLCLGHCLCPCLCLCLSQSASLSVVTTIFTVASLAIDTSADPDQLADARPILQPPNSAYTRNAV